MTSNRLLQECLKILPISYGFRWRFTIKTETVWQERSRSRRTRRHLKISVIQRQICRHWKPLPFSE